VAVDDGLVESVEGEEVGEIAYEHDGELLTAVDGPEGETNYDYDGNKRMTKVTLPNGTYAEIAYEATYGRVKSVTVSIEGGSPKTTYFNYEDQPQRKTTVTPPAPDPVTSYEFAADGSMFKSWNTKAPPTIDDVAGTLHDVEQLETASPIAPGLYNLWVQASSPEGIASIEIIANNDSLVSEKTCEQIPGEPVECPKEADEWVLETSAFAPGITYLEIIATDSRGESASERFWVNIPFTPPPDPEAEVPPKFSDILEFRDEFGLDLDVNGNEEAINDRVFNLIGDWNNPHTPTGAIARATAERWGIPMRLVDAAEMEYRESYIAHNGPLIQEWGEEQLPHAYAGYYVAHSEGGTLRIGFTDDPAEHLSALISAIHPVAPERLEAYTAPSNGSFTSLKGVEESVSAAAISNEALASSLRSIELDTETNKVVVTSANPASTSAIIAEIVGPSAPIEITGSQGPYHFTRLLAGENLRNRTVASQTHEFLSFCTAGPGAFEWRKSKSNGKRIRAEFLLSAGHCLDTANDVIEKSIYPRGEDNFTPTGHRAKNGLVGQQHYETDAQTIRLEGYHAPRFIYRPYRARLPIAAPARYDQGKVLCYSGVTSGIVRCGTAIGIRSIVIPEPNSGRMLNIKVEPKSGNPPQEGDSGAPVWEAGTRRIVGLVSGTEDGYGFVAPMLRPRGFPAEKVPGILAALDRPGGGDLKLEAAP
jgi:YD repeat-containing protein